MRVTETVDYSHVQDRHKAIHARLENWRKWHAPVIQTPVDTLDAVLVEKAVAALPTKQREALRWCYVHCNNPAAMARELAVSKQGLADLVSSARTMLTNTVKR